MLSPRMGLLYCLSLVLTLGCASPYRSTYQYPYGPGMHNSAPGYAPVMSNQPGMAPVITSPVPAQPGTFVPSQPIPAPSAGNNAPPFNSGNNNSPVISNPFPQGNGSSTYPVPQYDEPVINRPTTMNNPTQFLPTIVPENQPALIPASTVNSSTKIPFEQLPIADSPPTVEGTDVIKPVSMQDDTVKFERPISVDQVQESFSPQNPVIEPTPANNQPSQPATQGMPEIVPFSMEATQPQSQIIRKVNQEVVHTSAQTQQQTMMKLAYDGEHMRWVQGILTYDAAQQNWGVQYSRTPDPQDPYKGRINLITDQRLNRLKPQDLVQIEGQVTRTNNGEQRYLITNITKLDTSYQ